MRFAAVSHFLQVSHILSINQVALKYETGLKSVCSYCRSIAELQASISQSDMSLEEAMSKVLDLMKENQDLKG